MKKCLCLLAICLLSVIAYAQNSKKVDPTVDNPSIRKSKKEQSKQAKEFANDKRYSSLVNSHQAKEERKQQAKSSKGKGKGKGL